MPSRSLRRSVVILALAALLAPVAGLHAAQTRPQPAKAPSTAPHHNAVIQLLLGLLAGAGVQIDSGLLIDGNG
ncbi:MAG TPA: hypothetical protein VN970_07140 [Thermoanaerobaculia bacterium]|nr:hypothetical protein [Thermoanaerobaculia bacterium]